KPVLGRLFTRQDDSPSAPKTVILSHAYWQRKFGGDPSVVGRAITIDGNNREIIGVLPRSFTFLDDYDAALFLPMQLDRGKVKLGNFSFRGIARIKPGVSLNQVNAEIGRA